MTEDQLVKFYKTHIRPSAEYLSPAWHLLLSAKQSAELERQQSQALKFIYVSEISAACARKKADIETLSARRRAASKKFARKPEQS